MLCPSSLASASSSVHTSPWHRVIHGNYILYTYAHISPIYVHQIFNDSDLYFCGMYILLSDDKHQIVRDSSKKHIDLRRCNSNPVAMLPHAAVVFHMQPFNLNGSILVFLFDLLSCPYRQSFRLHIA